MNYGCIQWQIVTRDTYNLGLMNYEFLGLQTIVCLDGGSMVVYVYIAGCRVLVDLLYFNTCISYLNLKKYMVVCNVMM